mmetsp:Transcript_45825/g.88197  ORF Transcript_45825/g.88197 Transcript_45825/m.88197 type:complete len:208 (-) Transcript_45825:725-1348(-)
MPAALNALDCTDRETSCAENRCAELYRIPLHASYTYKFRFLSIFCMGHQRKQCHLKSNKERILKSLSHRTDNGRAESWGGKHLEQGVLNASRHRSCTRCWSVSRRSVALQGARRPCGKQSGSDRTAPGRPSANGTACGREPRPSSSAGRSTTADLGGTSDPWCAARPAHTRRGSVARCPARAQSRGRKRPEAPCSPGLPWAAQVARG